MAIRQEKRHDAPQPEVKDTDYGAKFIKAATETKVTPEVVTLEEQKEAGETYTVEAGGATGVAADVRQTDVTSADASQTAGEEKKPTEKPRKKGGRPKKTRK